MPLGIGTWSGGCQAQNSALWKRRKPRSPSPQPSPQGEGALSAVVRDVWTLRFVTTRPIVLPLLWGEGRGEGERGRRTDAATQNVSGTRETEPQFLVALDYQSALQAGRDALRRSADC